MSMLENPFAVRKLIEKSTAPYAKNPFCLMTDVSQLHGFNEFSELMQHAAKVFPDSWYICFNIPTTPKHPAADLVRLVPSILNDFNKTLCCCAPIYIRYFFAFMANKETTN